MKMSKIEKYFYLMFFISILGIVFYCGAPIFRHYISSDNSDEKYTVEETVSRMGFVKKILIGF